MMRLRNKRQGKRIHLVYYLLVFDRTTEQLAGHLVDIAPDGMKLMSQRPPQLEKLYRFRLNVPDTHEKAGTSIEFDARCVWCESNVYSDFFASGFHFERIAPDDITMIQSLVEAFGYHA